MKGRREKIQMENIKAEGIDQDMKFIIIIEIFTLIGAIFVIILPLLTGYKGSNAIKEKEVRATITNKYTGTKPMGKVLETTYNVKAQYDGLTDVENNESLYNALEKGDKVNAAIMVEKNKAGKVINRYLQIGY